MSISLNSCKGCRSYEEGVCVSQDNKLRLHSECPCQICLVKGICVTSCEDYDNHWETERN